MAPRAPNPLKILGLDGGGMNGYTTLLILKAIVEDVMKKQDLKIASAYKTELALTKESHTAKTPRVLAVKLGRKMKLHR